jgi:transposase
MSYSIDYRKAAIKFKESGHTFKELKEVFRITPQTYYNWLKLEKETGSLEKRKVESRERKIDLLKLNQALKEKPDAYLYELAKPFNCTIQAIFYALKKSKITYKKRLLHTLKSVKNPEQNISKK